MPDANQANFRLAEQALAIFHDLDEKPGITYASAVQITRWVMKLTVDINWNRTMIDSLWCLDGHRLGTGLGQRYAQDYAG